MENRSRRSRRGRFQYHNSPPEPVSESKTWSLFNVLESLFIMAALVALVFMMLEYHCSTCKAKGELKNLTKSIDDISMNLSKMKDSYYFLENRISQFSQDLPKIEGQMEILEALATTMDNVDDTNFGWNPKKQTLPNVDVYLAEPIKHCQMKNVSRKHANYPQSVKVQ